MHFNVCKFYLNKFGPPPKQNKLLKKLYLCTLLFFFTFNHFFCTLKNTITAYMHSSITNSSWQKQSISPGIQTYRLTSSGQLSKTNSSSSANIHIQLIHLFHRTSSSNYVPDSFLALFLLVLIEKILRYM